MAGKKQDVTIISATKSIPQDHKRIKLFSYVKFSILAAQFCIAIVLFISPSCCEYQPYFRQDRRPRPSYSQGNPTPQL